MRGSSLGGKVQVWLGEWFSQMGGGEEIESAEIHSSKIQIYR